MRTLSPIFAWTPRASRSRRRRIVFWRRASGAGFIVFTLGAALWYLGNRVHEERIEARVERYVALVEVHATRAGLSAPLVQAVIRAESGGDPRAVSTKNARGLMQIRPAAESDVLGRLGVSKGDLFDPDYNILIGTTYLKMLHDRFDGDLPLVLAAYHMGPTRVRRIQAKDPGLGGRELVSTHAGPATRVYVKNVLDQMDVPVPRE